MTDPEPRSLPDGRPTLRAVELRKSFGPTRALASASLDVRGGRIVGLVGENGSGKSTLIKILSGVLPPDGGRVEIDGARFDGFRRPAHALALGIGTVFQEILVNQATSVLDNVWLGYDAVLSARVKSGARRARARALLEQISSEPIDLDAPAERLPLSQQQLVAIARTLVREPRILILDEATSALDVRDRDLVFAHCRRLRDEGCALVFVTHRLEELLSLADELVVIRDGQTVATLECAAADRRVILELMTRVAQERAVVADAPPPPAAERRPLLSVQGMDVGGGSPFDWRLESGIVVGLAGLEGHGQERFLRALAGVEGSAAGTVEAVDGSSSTPIRTRFDAARAGVFYLPRSRGRDGIFPSLSVLDNFSLPTLGRSTRLGLLRLRRLRRVFRQACETLQIRLASPQAPITSLSGGNQQKVLIARWLAADPRVLLLDDPTRGVDLPTKVDLHALLRREARGGRGVVVLSSELEELEELCDAVLVFHEGRLAARLDGGAVERERVIAAMFGAAA